MRVLCLHQSVDGATFGVHNFTFKYSRDVVDIKSIPEEVVAVLTGHIHRFQVLDRDLSGQTIPAPVFYPGSIERTSFAEREEPKGYITIDIDATRGGKGMLESWEFHELPTRPMRVIEYPGNVNFESWIIQQVSGLPPNSIVKLKMPAPVDNSMSVKISAENLRCLVPETMNISISVDFFRNAK